MSYLKTVDPEDAEGLLQRLYSAAIRRAGKVFNIIRVQSPRPRVLRASTQLYMEVMHSASSGLSRAQREMIATVASRETGCFYWTKAHGEDLREEVRDLVGGDELADSLQVDYRTADISRKDRSMLDFVGKLTSTPSEVTMADVEHLRAVGFDDGSVHDIVQVTALFAYYTRLAEGLGADPETDW